MNSHSPITIDSIFGTWCARCGADLNNDTCYCPGKAPHPHHAWAPPTLTERRAIFIYEAARLAAIAAGAPVIPAPLSEREPEFRTQFLKVIGRQCGPLRSSSPEELHEDWVQAYLKMGWVYGPHYDPHARIHPDLVPYAQLDQLERDKDAVFVSLCDIAREYIYEPISTT